MNDQKNCFAERLVKGRIAETLFEQMLYEAGGFTVLAFGYEKTLPELAHLQSELHPKKEAMEIVRHAPDFAVINNETHDVHLIEVKYKSSFDKRWILEDAERMFKTWKPSYLFLMTPEGFFFDRASQIIDNEGEISKFQHKQISKELQQKYLDLLNEFIAPIA